MPSLDPDRLFGVAPAARDMAREIHAEIAGLPIISPHGHVNPAWFADNLPFRMPQNC